MTCVRNFKQHCITRSVHNYQRNQSSALFCFKNFDQKCTHVCVKIVFVICASYNLLNSAMQKTWYYGPFIFMLTWIWCPQSMYIKHWHFGDLQLIYSITKIVLNDSMGYEISPFDQNLIWKIIIIKL